MGVCLTDLADELSKLVQVTLSLRCEAQLPDSTVELLRPFKRVLDRRKHTHQHTHKHTHTLFNTQTPAGAGVSL